MNNGVKFLAYMLSRDNNILNWDPDSLNYIIPASYINNGITYEIRYPTLIDQDYQTLVNDAINNGLIPLSEKSERRNFDLTGQQPYIYATIRKGQGNQELNLVRFRISLELQSIVSSTPVIKSWL